MHAHQRGRFFSTVDLVNALEQEKQSGKQGQIAHRLVHADLVILDELGYPFAIGELDPRDLAGLVALPRLANLDPARVYNAFLRVGRQLRLGQSRAAVAANAVALRHTGIDVLQEMPVQPEELIAAAELTVADGEADQLAERLKGWLDSSPAPNVTSDEIIAGLGLAVAGHERRAAETRIGILMSRLGWLRRKRRNDYRRRFICQRPSSPSDMEAR